MRMLNDYLDESIAIPIGIIGLGILVSLYNKNFTAILVDVVVIFLFLCIREIYQNFRTITKAYNSLETKYNDLFTQFQIHEQNRDEHNKS